MRTSFPGTAPQARAQVSAWTLCLALLLAGGVAGCSGDETGQRFSAPASATQVGVTTPTVRTSVALGRVVGRLPAQRRHSVRRQVGDVIDRWWEAAYVSAPRTDADLASAFPGFTDGARSRARADHALTTNAGLHASAVSPLMRKVHLDLLSVNTRVRSVTARFDLRLRVTGADTGVDAGADAGAQAGAGAGSSVRPRRLQIRGRLFLTHRASGWKVFGYDISKGWL